MVPPAFSKLFPSKLTFVAWMTAPVSTAWRVVLARYTTGTVYKVRNCDNSRPPVMAMPIGRRNSEPVPEPSASGSAPSRAAMVVIMIGRKRSKAA